MRKPGPALLGTLIGIIFGSVMVAILFIGDPYGRRQPKHPVCLQSHREVVLIPTICGEHDVCQKPIVADVCERIEAPPPKPMCKSTGDTDDAN